MSKSSLSSVVSNLVRASMGASVSNTVNDEDLDRHVAELILKEAKQNAERYGKDGIQAYLPRNNWYVLYQLHSVGEAYCLVFVGQRVMLRGRTSDS